MNHLVCGIYKGGLVAALFLVALVGVEPTRPIRPTDFKSGMSAIPSQGPHYKPSIEAMTRPTFWAPLTSSGFNLWV